MVVSINQPAYLPWLGYFERIAVSDLHIVLDHVQFEKNSFTNRNKIRTAEGWTWLTVPVLTKGKFGDLGIHELEIDNRSNWRGKHWRAITQNYGKAPHFQEHAPFFEELYGQEWTRLGELCDAATSYLLKAFDIDTPLQKSSGMQPEGAKDDLVLDLCRKAGAKSYLSGALGRDYLREEIFEEAGVDVRFQDYQHPEYEQARRQGFEPYMAAIDLLFNCGPESRAVLLGS